MSEKLPIAIEAIKAGNKQLGQQLLAQILQSDPNNEQAWLWMSAVVDEEKQRYCLERTLKINPNNSSALQALRDLNRKTQTSKPRVEFSHSTPKLEAPIKDNEEHHKHELPQKASITRTVIKDGLKIGIIGGIIGLVISFFYSLLFQNRVLNDVWAVIIIGTCISTSITNGIVFFRRRIGANLGVSMGGFSSGFVSGSFISLVYGLILFRPSSENFTLGVMFYLLFCGIFIPTFSGIIGSVAIWIPRLFINPYLADNKEKHSPSNQDTLEAPPISAHNHSHLTQKIPVTKEVVTDHPIAVSPVQEEHSTTKDDPKFWISPTRTTAFIFSLAKNELYIGSAPIVSLQKIRDHVSKNESLEKFVTTKENIPYKNIKKVRQILSTIRIFYTKSGQETTEVLDCQDAKMADEITKSLKKHLGSHFDETSAPIGTGISVFISSIAMLVVLAGTAFFYYGAYELESGMISPRGSSRTRGILNLLEFLGTNGVLVIGGILFLLAVGIMIYLIKNPPTVTELIRKSSQKIEEPLNYSSEMKHPTTSIPPSKPEQPFLETSESSTGVIFIDGLLSGLILGVIGAILPGIAIFTGNKQTAQLGMYLIVFLMLFSGILTGMLFQGRNIGKSQSIVLGGAIAGALTGLLAGMVLGLSPQNDTIVNINTQDGFKIYMMSCMVNPSIGGGFIGAFSAWMFGFTSKDANSITSTIPNAQKIATSRPDAEQIPSDSIWGRFIEMFKRRLILTVVLGGIIFICTFCLSLMSSL